MPGVPQKVKASLAKPVEVSPPQTFLVGTVRTFDGTRGWGIITEVSGEEFLVLRKDISMRLLVKSDAVKYPYNLHGGKRFLAAGERVAFNPQKPRCHSSGYLGKMKRAVGVRRLEHVLPPSLDAFLLCVRNWVIRSLAIDSGLEGQYEK